MHLRWVEAGPQPFCQAAELDACDPTRQLPVHRALSRMRSSWCMGCATRRRRPQNLYVALAAEASEGPSRERFLSWSLCRRSIRLPPLGLPLDGSGAEDPDGERLDLSSRSREIIDWVAAAGPMPRSPRARESAVHGQEPRPAHLPQDRGQQPDRKPPAKYSESLREPGSPE